jgi:hypothetical protein
VFPKHEGRRGVVDIRERWNVPTILRQSGVVSAWTAGCRPGGLIQVAVGFAGGSVCFLTKRSGVLLKALSGVI